MNEGIIKEGQLIVVTGPMATGKDTIREVLIERHPEIERVMSTTTRPPREGEIDGVTYHFITEEEYQIKAANGDFFQSIDAHLKDKDGNPQVYRYANERSHIMDVLVGKIVLWQISIDKAAIAEEIIESSFEKEIADKLKERLTKIFIGIPRLTVLKDRAYKRDAASRNNFRVRIVKEWNEWVQFRHHFHHTIINADLNTAVAEFEALIPNLISAEGEP